VVSAPGGGNDPPKRRRFDPGAPVHLNLVNAPPTPTSAGGTQAPSPRLYITNYDPARYMEGNARMRLEDVRGAPTTVSVRSDGTLADDVVWEVPAPGAYTVIFDANGDGYYDGRYGDFANFDNEIDFIVEDSAETHSKVVTVDDRGAAREIFNASVAHHIYVRARDLPVETDVDVYVISKKRMDAVLVGSAAFTTWDQLRSRGTLQLASVAVPLNATEDPIMAVSNPPEALIRKQFRTDDQGKLFASVWHAPANLSKSRVLAVTPPVAVDWPTSGPEGPDEDGCGDAWTIDASDEIKRICNIGNSFFDYYGNEFSIVIDVNHDGRLNQGDVIDDHDVGDLTAYFATHDMLNGQSTEVAAITEYQEYLTTKLSLAPSLGAILSESNRYGPRTEEASKRLYVLT
jgi:hypothetical protein